MQVEVVPSLSSVMSLSLLGRTHACGAFAIPCLFSNPIGTIPIGTTSALALSLRHRSTPLLRHVNRRSTMTVMTGNTNGNTNGNATVPWMYHRANPSTAIIGPGEDWITPLLKEYLSDATAFRPPSAVFTHPPRILVLHGSLRVRGFSKLLSYECARLLEGMGAEVRTYDPHGLPVRDPEVEGHAKVVELRELVQWSEAQVWAASELHGNLCSVFKNQIDWIPLNTGSVRPTQGKSVAVLQVNGGSQSFNVVNTLRLLARWMRMGCVVNQSSVQMAWKEFDEEGRMRESGMRDRVVDVMEELIKVAWVNREYADVYTDRFSERKERAEKGRLMTQEEKEEEKEEEKDTAMTKAKANE